MALKTISLSLSFALLLSSCTNTIDTTDIRFKGYPKPPTEGSEGYIHGWKDGCKTGRVAYSNTLLRSTGSMHVDGVRMGSDPDYNRGWLLGNRYCMYYTSRYLSIGYFDDADFEHSDLRTPNQWFNVPDGLNPFKMIHRPED